MAGWPGRRCTENNANATWQMKSAVPTNISMSCHVNVSSSFQAVRERFNQLNDTVKTDQPEFSIFLLLFKLEFILIFYYHTFNCNLVVVLLTGKISSCCKASAKKQTKKFINNKLWFKTQNYKQQTELFHFQMCQLNFEPAQFERDQQCTWAKIAANSKLKWKESESCQTSERKYILSCRREHIYSTFRCTQALYLAPPWKV